MGPTQAGLFAPPDAATPSALLVSACDKLYNARSILVDVMTVPAGEDVFDRFKQVTTQVNSTGPAAD